MIKPGNEHAAWLKGSNVCCVSLPTRPRRIFRLVLLGAPGVGKGTQAELLCGATGACHLSTGDVFRAAGCLSAGERSPALKEAIGFMKRGELVPDKTVLAMVWERRRCLRCAGGFLLDGFPRTIEQAAALENMLHAEQIDLSAVLDYELPREEIIKRISGRRTCPSCNAIFHLTSNPPRAKGMCDDCGARLFQREDDRPKSVRVRLQAYEQNTKPLIDFYRKRGLLISISAKGSPGEVLQRTLSALKL